MKAEYYLDHFDFYIYFSLGIFFQNKSAMPKKMMIQHWNIFILKTIILKQEKYHPMHFHA